MESNTPLLQATGLTKSYNVKALDGVDFELRRGEVHALVGENGAGKSTLAKIIGGVTHADAGKMLLDGSEYCPRSRSDAARRGVRMVMQELNLVGNLTVAESIFLDQLPHRFGWIDYARLNRLAGEALARVGLAGVDPRQPVRSLGVGQQQLVEIAAGLSRRCDVFILDEPTAALTDREIGHLFEQIQRLKAGGAGLIYISHRLEEIKKIADRVSVLRDGRKVITCPAGELSMDEIVRLMVGRELGANIRGHGKKRGREMLRVDGLSDGRKVHGVSFSAYSGEILGVAGLMGSGRTETLRLIFGADTRRAGAIYLRGSATPASILSPRDAVRNGMALLTEDRKEHGLVLPLSIRANITLARMEAVSSALGWIRSGAEMEAASQWSERLGVRCSSVEQRVAELSGGTQQKVAMAKWLFRDCDILLFDEPTRGIDVGAKFEIYQILQELAAQEKAVVVVSSDLLELMAISDRILVLSNGRVTGEFKRGEWTQDKIMAAALSGYATGTSL